MRAIDNDHEFEPDRIWFYCQHCDGNYYLPETAERCPICESDDIEPC